jgi:cytochrome c-type biogenesis protein CcsB
MMHALFKVLPLLALCLSPLAGKAAGAREESGLEVSTMAEIVVMSNGRMKPLRSHARESLYQIFGEEAVGPASDLATYVSLLLHPETWQDRECLYPGEELSSEFFEGKEVLSPAEVSAAHQEVAGFIRQVQGRGAMGRMSRATPSGRERILSEQGMRLLNSAFTLQSLSRDFLFLPHPTLEETWLSPMEAHAFTEEGPSYLQEGVQAYRAMEKAYREGDPQAFAEAVADLKAAQRAAPAPVLSESLMALENLYYAVDVHKVGLILFCLSGLLYLLCLARKSPGIGRIALVALVAGILWNTWIIGGRTAIGGRLPLKNLNEVYLVVLFLVPLIGLLLQLLFKNPMYAGVSAAMSIIGFIGALFLPTPGYVITPLVAILISPWREVHILTIMLSYAIMLVAMGLHLAFLGVVFFQPSARTVNEGKIVYAPIAQDLDRKAYLMVVWGFLFLSMGIATGAAWAHSSWGRYWGWDPKEVWATVAWALYAFFLHLRLFFHVRKEVLALINLIGFAAILFTYFGVSFLLSGLHAYSS